MRTKRIGLPSAAKPAGRALSVLLLVTTLALPVASHPEIAGAQATVATRRTATAYFFEQIPGGYRTVTADIWINNSAATNVPRHERFKAIHVSYTEYGLTANNQFYSRYGTYTGSGDMSLSPLLKHAHVSHVLHVPGYPESMDCAIDVSWVGGPLELTAGGGASDVWQDEWVNARRNAEATVTSDCFPSMHTSDASLYEYVSLYAMDGPSDTINMSKGF